MRGPIALPPLKLGSLEPLSGQEASHRANESFAPLSPSSSSSARFRPSALRSSPSHSAGAATPKSVTFREAVLLIEEAPLSSSSCHVLASPSHSPRLSAQSIFPEGDSIWGFLDVIKASQSSQSPTGSPRGSPPSSQGSPSWQSGSAMAAAAETRADPPSDDELEQFRAALFPAAATRGHSRGRSADAVPPAAGASGPAVESPGTGVLAAEGLAEDSNATPEEPPMPATPPPEVLGGCSDSLDLDLPTSSPSQSCSLPPPPGFEGDPLRLQAGS
eukprot:EG_transcript_9559